MSALTPLHQCDLEIVRITEEDGAKVRKMVVSKFSNSLRCHIRGSKTLYGLHSKPVGWTFSETITKQSVIRKDVGSRKISKEIMQASASLSKISSRYALSLDPKKITSGLHM